MKRRSMTLLEVLISLPLLAILLSFTAQTTAHLLRHNKSFERQNMVLKHKHYFQRRFQQILMRIHAHKLKLDDFKKEQFSFEFLNGYSPVEAFSGPLKGILHLQQDRHELTFSLFRQDQCVRREVFLNDVQHLSLKYWFEYPQRDEAQINPFELTSEVRAPQLAKCCAVEMDVTRKSTSKKETYFFLLKRSQSPIY